MKRKTFKILDGAEKKSDGSLKYHRHLEDHVMDHHKSEYYVHESKARDLLSKSDYISKSCVKYAVYYSDINFALRAADNDHRHFIYPFDHDDQRFLSRRSAMFGNSNPFSDEFEIDTLVNDNGWKTKPLIRDMEEHVKMFDVKSMIFQNEIHEYKSEIRDCFNKVDKTLKELKDELVIDAGDIIKNYEKLLFDLEKQQTYNNKEFDSIINSQKVLYELKKDFDKAAEKR